MDSPRERGAALKALVLYWSKTGNTRKVAQAIERGVTGAGASALAATVGEAAGLDLYDFDLVFFGAPSYSFMPPEQVLRYIKEKMDFHRRRGDIKVRAPKVPGKRAVVFVTYSGPHTGIDEAIPAGKIIGQFLAHIGFDVLDEWYVVGEFHGNELHSTQGPLGDIHGRPSEDDLARIERQTAEIVVANTAR